MTEDLAGRTLGKYELRERLGRGGMAEVYRGYHATLDRFVAIKILHPFLGEDPEFKDRFEREARNVAKLRHPNIVQVYDFDHEPGSDLYYMVMEYVDGPTLRTRLTQLSFQGQWTTIPEAIRITRDLASALAYAHARDMVHRDIKPANIMLDSDGRVVLTDFGIARMVTGPQMTASGTMVGTPAFMSPEQGLGQPGDHRSDIYSLGVVLYQLAAGVLPYDADTPIAIVLKHVNEPLPPPSSINPEMPEGLERVIYKALAKSPDERYQSVEDMALHLDDLDAASTLVIPTSALAGHPAAAGMASGATLPANAAAPARAGTPGSAQPRRRSGLWFAIIGVLLASLGVVGGAYATFSGLFPIAISQLGGNAEEVSPIDETPNPYTPTPDQQATLLQATIDSLAATSAAAFTGASPTPAPDLTATAIVCDFDYELVDQSPDDAAIWPDNAGFTKRITIINDSRCSWDDDTRLVFFSGNQLSGPDIIEFNRILDPGEQYTIELLLRTPDYIPGSGEREVESTWRIEFPDGTPVGSPFTFRMLLYDRDTEAAPETTPTPTATPERAAPLVFTSEQWEPLTCGTNPSNAGLYVCNVQLNFTGGQGPYEIIISPTVRYTCDAPPCYVEFGGPRCDGVPWGATIEDSRGQSATSDFWFSPEVYSYTFVDDSC